MQKTIRCTFKLRGTEEEIEEVKARLATLSADEGVISLYMGEEEQFPVDWREALMEREKTRIARMQRRKLATLELQNAK